MTRKLTLAGAFTFAILIAASASASINDFALQTAVVTGDSVSALDLTPDSRFVVFLSRRTGKVSFLDTWDFNLVAGDTAQVLVASGNTVALCLSASPSTALPFLYVGLSNGRVAIVDYSLVSALMPSEGLVAAPPVSYFTLTGNSVEAMVAAPEVNGSNVAAYLIAAVPSQNHLFWTRLQAGNQFTQAYQMTLTRTPLALARGKHYAYDLERDGVGNHFLEIVSCSELNRLCIPLEEPALLIAPGDIFRALAADPSKDLYSVTANLTQGKLWLLDNFDPDPPIVVLADTFTVDLQPSALAAQPTVFDTGLGDVAFSVGGNTLALTEINTATLAFGAHRSLDAGGPVTTLVAAGGSEGYAFAGDPDGAILPITANPWLSSLTAGVSGSTVTLSFTPKTNATGSLKWALYKNGKFHDWPKTLPTDSSSTTPNTLVITSIKLADLKECLNVLTVIVQDLSGRQGRDATTVFKDAVPPAPSFNLAFGRQKLIADFTAANLCDLDRYEIYWGDTNPLPESNYLLLEPFGGKIVINDPHPGRRIERIIGGLTDGKTYWVQLVVFDHGGLTGVSARQSAAPQAVETLTDAAGEEGGVKCLGSVGTGPAGDPRGLLGLALPFLAYAAWRAARRERP